MDELLNLSEDSIQFKPAEVKFPQYAEFKLMAEKMVENLHDIVVTEDNIVEVKKDLAKVRKIVIELNNRRKLIKSEILSEYTTFEAMIKDIDNTITSGENYVRDQARLIEEAEREHKKETIRDIWNKRISAYGISAFGDFFDKWLTPQHLNKTTTMKSIEKDMVDWLETREKEMSALSSMDNEYLVEYVNCLDMSKAIENVNNRRQIASLIESDEDEDEETAMFIVTGKKNIKLAEMLLRENDINFRRK